LRPVDDALEGQIVVALGDQAEIGHGIANLRALVEAWAADDAIGNAERKEAVLELAHLKTRAHQHRHFRIGMIVAMQLLRIGRDRARFFFGIPHTLYTNAITGIALGPQGLAEPALVRGDEAGSGTENRRCRAVIPLEADDFRAGKIALKAQDVFDLG